MHTRIAETRNGKVERVIEERKEKEGAKYDISEGCELWWVKCTVFQKRTTVIWGYEITHFLIGRASYNISEGP